MKELSVDDGITRHRDLLSRNQLLLLDTTVLTLAWALAWTLRFEGLGWLVEWRRAAGMHLALSIPLWLGVLTIFQLYRRIWSLASIEEVESLIAAVAIGAIANVCVALFVLPLTGLTVSRLPLSVVSSFTMLHIVNDDTTDNGNRDAVSPVNGSTNSATHTLAIAPIATAAISDSTSSIEASDQMRRYS